MLRKKKANINFFKVFGSKCFVIKIIDNDGEFDAKSYEAIFLGYSLTSCAYRVHNLSTNHIVEDSIDVSFQEYTDDLSREEEDCAGTSTGIKLTVKETGTQPVDRSTSTTSEGK